MFDYCFNKKSRIFSRIQLRLKMRLFSIKISKATNKQRKKKRVYRRLFRLYTYIAFKHGKFIRMLKKKESRTRAAHGLLNHISIMVTVVSVNKQK